MLSASDHPGETGPGEESGGTDSTAAGVPGRDPLSLEAGQQALLAVPSMTSPIEYLPDAAFENLLVVTVRSPAKIERVVAKRGGDPRKVGVVPLASSDVDYSGPLWTSRRVSPTDLTGISIESSRGAQYLRRGEGWFVLDNVHALLMYCEERRIYRLLDSLRGSFADRDVRGVYAVVRSTVGPEYERYRSLFDVEIDRS